METEEDGKEDSKWKQKKMEKKIIDGNKRRWKGHVERKNEHRRIKKTEDSKLKQKKMEKRIVDGNRRRWKRG